MKGVLDACFLIDWGKYGRSEILRKLFKNIVVSDEVWDEIESEQAAILLGTWYAEGFFYKAILTPEDMRDVDQLLEQASDNPSIGALHKAEATALVYAKKRGFNHVLSENKVVKRVVESIEEYKNLKVWSAIDILKEAMIRGILVVKNENDFDYYLDEYSEQTKHFFNKVSRDNAKREVLRILKL